MKCMFCENVDLFKLKDCEIISEHHEGMYCPRCDERYILNKNTGLLMRVDEMEFDEYEADYYDSGNPRGYVDNFIEEFVMKNIKEREETFGEPSISNYNDIIDYVKETINENELIKEELDSISGTVTQLIEEYEELQEESDPGYLTLGQFIELTKDLDKNTPLIIQKDSEGNDYSPLIGIDSGYVYTPTTTWFGEVTEGYDDENLSLEPGKPVNAILLIPIN